MLETEKARKSRIPIFPIVNNNSFTDWCRARERTERQGKNLDFCFKCVSRKKEEKIASVFTSSPLSSMARTQATESRRGRPGGKHF